MKVETPPPADESAYLARGLEAWLPAASAVLALLACLVFVVGGRDFCLDDAWIHLSYAKSLLAGDGFSYNPGDHETGFSSPLWVVMLAAWPRSADPVVSVKMLGALLHAVSAWLACVLALELGHKAATVQRPLPLATIGLLAGALVALQPAALQGAVSGMENSLTAALVMALGLASLRRAWPSAALLAAFAVWARPEALAFAGLLSLGAWRSYGRAALAIAASAALALSLWVVYALAVSGHPWPNTYYVKAQGSGQAWAFVLRRVLTPEAWIVSLGGLVAAGAALRGEARAGRHWLAVWMLAWLGCYLAIAVSRPLNPGVGFYEARYFTAFGAPPLIAVALGVAYLPRAVAVVAMVGVLGFGAYQAKQLRELVHDQELDINLLHTQPAQYIARELPATFTVLVEGAGATRYWAPRSLRIVDALGLNFAEVAHAPDDAAKACALVRQVPSAALLPMHIAGPLSRVFDFELVANFDDPHYAIVDPPQAMRVSLFTVRGVQPAWQARCALAGSTSPG